MDDSLNSLSAHQPETLTFYIEDNSRSGSGIGRHPEDGRVVFVPYSMQGDRVEVKVTRTKKHYLEAEIIRFLEKSPQRLEAKCSYYMHCGGCQLQHMDYPAQWKLKKDGVLSLFKGIPLPEVDVFPADEIWNYRNKIYLKGRGAELGFYRKSTHQWMDIQNCEIAHPALNKKLKEVKLQAAQIFKNQEYTAEIQMDGTGKVQVIYQNPPSSLGFRQVNEEQNLKLISWIQNTFQNEGCLIDLFGGAGNLSLPLMTRFQEIHCVDQNQKHSTSDSKIQFSEMDVKKWMKIKKSSFQKYPLPISILVDPPRRGIGPLLPLFLENFIYWNVKELILIGCEPDPWIRDLKQFSQNGYQLQKLALFDFFPHTRHIESAAYLTRLF